ncbi:MAG: hypothetical protein MPJ82_07785 [Alphaproteobacteria bacterium]|nr:hypothetical protein [Alphaproteobacteria bacterium]
MNIPVLIIAIVLLSSCAMPPAGLQRGKDALLDRDYAAAFREFQPLAEQGNAEAQFHLGNFYITGKGAPRIMQPAQNGTVAPRNRDTPKPSTIWESHTRQDKAFRWTLKRRRSGSSAPPSGDSPKPS